MKATQPVRGLAPSYILYAALLCALVGVQLMRLAADRPDWLSQRALLSASICAIALVAALYALWRIRHGHRVNLLPLMLAILPAVAVGVFLAALPDRLLDNKVERAYDTLRALKGDQVSSVRVTTPGDARQLMRVTDPAALRGLVAAIKTMRRQQGLDVTEGSAVWDVTIDGTAPVHLRCFRAAKPSEGYVLAVIEVRTGNVMPTWRLEGQEMKSWLDQNVAAPLAAASAAPLAMP